MTTTLTPLDLYRERIPVARAAFDDAFGLLPVPQRSRDMARRLWQQVHAQVPEMPVPTYVSGNSTYGIVHMTWLDDRHRVETLFPCRTGGYALTFWDFTLGITPATDYCHSIQSLLRVCQRFVAATAREVR